MDKLDLDALLEKPVGIVTWKKKEYLIRPITKKQMLEAVSMGDKDISGMNPEKQIEHWEILTKILGPGLPEEVVKECNYIQLKELMEYLFNIQSNISKEDADIKNPAGAGITN